MVNVGGNERTPGSDFIAHEFGGEVGRHAVAGARFRGVLVVELGTAQQAVVRKSLLRGEL